MRPDGIDYRGSVSQTIEGYTCQAWSDQFPHEHKYTEDYYFPDDNITAASNYCRNPDGDAFGPWCMIVDGDEDAVYEYYGYCIIPMCSEPKPGMHMK